MPPRGARRGSGPERRDQHLSGVGARPGAGRRRRAARRGASARQGHLRHGRRADDVRVVDLQDERAGPVGGGGGARRARGCDRDRQGESARVRLGHHEPEPALRGRRQSRHPRSDRGRLERGQRGRSGGATVLAGARDGYGRIGSRAVRLLPRRRLQAGSRHDPHRRLLPPVTHVRHGCADGAVGCGLHAALLGAVEGCHARSRTCGASSSAW